MRMRSGWALVAVLVSLISFNSCSSSTNPATGSGILWVATQGDQMVTTFSVNEGSGAGTQVGHPVSLGTQPIAMAMTPDRSIIFVAGTGGVQAYSVHSDGSLTAIGSLVQVSPSPSGLAVDPSGKFLFVVSQGNARVLGQAGTQPGQISVFSVSSSAAPAPIPNSPFPSALPGDVTGNGPSAVVVAPQGSFVYVANQFSNTVAAFAYDTTAGSLSLVASYSTGINPAALAFSRCAGGASSNPGCTTADNATLFVANSGSSNDISAFNACLATTPTCPVADGSLQVVPGSPFASGGLGPTSVFVSTQLDFVYVVDKLSNEISQFKYSPSTGALTPLSPATISTGSSPMSGGITSDSKMVLVPDNGGSEIAAFTVNSQTSTSGQAPSGRLARASNPSITLSAQPSAVIVR